MTTEKLLIPDKEAAQLLSIGRSTFWREVKAGNLPQPVRIGGATRWRLADLRRSFESPATVPTTAPGGEAPVPETAKG